MPVAAFRFQYPDTADPRFAELDESYIRGYFYCVALSETLRGLYGGENVDVPALFGVQTAFDEKNCFCCMTGLTERVCYAYGLSPKGYVDLYREIKALLLEELSRFGCAADVFLETRFDANRIVILFSPKGKQSTKPLAVAERISEVVQRVYEARLFKGVARHCNFTALSDRLSGFKEVRSGYRAVRQLGEYAFFFRSPVVVTESWIAARRKEADYHEVMVACMDVKLALTNREKRRFADCLKKLFGLLRDSLSFSHCRSALAFLENLLEVYCGAYRIEDVHPKALCDLFAYDYLDDCHDAILRAAEGILALSKDRPCYSGVVQEALYYIRHNFRGDVSLPDIARYAEITPAYLSTLFKREVGVSISEYATALRIEEAKRLLAQSGKKVSEIALEVGFHDVKYFGRAFRQRVHEGPSAYRERMRQEGNNAGDGA